MNAKKKTLRPIVLVVLSVLVVCAAVWGILTLVKNVRRETVKVYSVRDFSMSDYYGDSSQTYGEVTTDRIQKVYIPSTQTVTEICVTEGQTVSVGDKLLSFDTTLTNLDLQRAKVALERQEMAYQDLKKEADYWAKDGKCRQQLEEEQKKLMAQKEKLLKDAGISLPDVKEPVLPEGDGSRENPLCLEIPDPSAFAFSEDWMRQTLLSSSQEPGDPTFVILAQKITGDDLAYYTVYQGVKLTGTWSADELPRLESVAMQLVSGLEIPLEETVIPDIEDTKLQKKIRDVDRQLGHLRLLLDEPDLPEKPADLEKWKNDLTVQLKAREVELKLAQLELKNREAEVKDGAVYSEIDGVVKVVRDAEQAYNEGTAVVEVSGGGGYYISGVLSELELDTVQIGQTVTINSWMTGTSCEGSIVEIGNVPSSNNQGWSNGNNNVSWYAMKVFVSDDANLQPGDYVDMTYQSSAAQDGSSLYLETMFIRTENGKSYVMLQGEDGCLTQRFIQTGKDLWGSYTEILGGLTVDDFVAFPYGKDVQIGAKTEESTPDQFYSYY